MTHQELDKRLTQNGWTWGLLSLNGEPHVQLLADLPGGMDMPERKNIFGDTIEEAIDNAEKFVISTTPSEYFSNR